MKFYIIIFLLFFSLFTSAQVNEPVSNQVYEYLYRMAEKGLIDIDDYILPLERSTIKSLLDSLSNNRTQLSGVERKELQFYLADYYIDNKTGEDEIGLLKKDTVGRFRCISIMQKKNRLMAEPIFGISANSYSNKKGESFFGGARFFGNLGKNIGFNLIFRDITEKGDSIDIGKTFTNTKGSSGGQISNKTFNYSELSFNIGYRWKTGLLTFGKDNMIWGYAQSGNLVLSNKAPSYPYIRLDYYPARWLHFNYMHGWLMSDVVDSSRTYVINTGTQRITYIPKFIANHSLTATAFKGFTVSIGESMVYSDKFDIGYLFPVNFFKGYDHYTSNSDIRAGGNGQFFAQVSSRNNIKNTHLYAVLFIDEIKLSKIFNKTERRNQLGYTIGGSITDIGIKYLTLGAEYTHINPFVYANLIPAQYYTSHSYSLGDWMGSNADRIYAFAKYTPLAKLKIDVGIQFIRKGGAGTVQQQYDQQPQPAFLFNKLFDQKDLYLSLKYELIQSFKFYVNANYFDRSFPNEPDSKGFSFSIGLSYGL